MAHEDMLILYATETGNAEDVAERIGREATRRNFKARVMSLDKFSPAQLASQALVIFVVSTTGQGHPPSAMKGFWKTCLKPLGDLKDLQFAVFGLGDSGYQQYNVVAKRLDKRLAQAGARAIVPIGLGDDQHRSGYEGALDPWLVSLWNSLPGSSESKAEDAAQWVLDPPKYRIVCHEQAVSSLGHFSDSRQTWECHERARAMVDRASGSYRESASDENTYGRAPSNPVFTQVLRNKRLTDEAHEQDVRHLEFDLGDSGLEYTPGDVLGVFPKQDTKAVDEFLQRCQLDPNAFVTVEPSNNFEKVPSQPVTVRTLVEAVLDVASASPRRYLFEVMMHFAKAEHERDRLQYFATSEGRDDLYKYNQRERRTVLEVLQDFPSVDLPLEWLVQLVPKLRPRYFSISSSVRAHPSEVHLTVAVIRWETPYKRTRKGLCSTWLSELKPKTDIVPIWVTGGLLKLPPPSVPLILVGPGTGCAPFRAFIEERSAQSANQPVAPILFVFGCRYRSKDFLYEQQWDSLTKSGVLSEEAGGGFFVAFSRDQPYKVYVQHKIRERPELVFKLLLDEAFVFVSGSAEKMPEDVFSAFKDVVAAQSGVTSQDAVKWLKRLERLGRYTIEVWS